MTITFRTTAKLNDIPYETLLNTDPHHPHIHRVDIPFRVNSTYQDRGCEVGVWEQDSKLVAWALVQPPWGVLDHALHPCVQGTGLESAVYIWGLSQMQAYADRTGEKFAGTIEYYENTLNLEQKERTLKGLGFKPVDWSVYRYFLDLTQEQPLPRVADGYIVRPFAGAYEAGAYAGLIDNVFGPNWLTADWKLRLLSHPQYIQDLDLVIEEISTGELVGFCHCWMLDGVAQIEPLGVHPKHCRLGLGSALERTALQVCKARGAHTMLVDHGSTNEGAILLSKKTGFQQMNTELRFAVDVKG